MSDLYVWKGKEFRTIGDIVTEIGNTSPEEAKALCDDYCSKYIHGRHNLGYFSGYCSDALAKKIFAAIGTTHPIFGDFTK
jgi:hypothetical protein